MKPDDYLIVGGGLQGGLVALALRHHRPHATVTILERDRRPGGNHTWSFHADDLPSSAAEYVRPLVAGRWPGYLVRFPGFAREVRSGYASISSDRFAAALTASGCDIRTDTEVVEVGDRRVRLADGRSLGARCVIDARGPEFGRLPTGTGYQKFLGLEIETQHPWPQDRPTIMDATVVQSDGFRFVYVLPFSPHRVLVEDTYFSDSPTLDRDVLRNRVRDYIAAREIGEWRIIREESGVLPMPWAGSGIAAAGGPLVLGYAGGWFHPATGYSFPLAVRLAEAIAGAPPEEARSAVAAFARGVRPRQRFARLLNRLLFRAVVPDRRWRVFARLYRQLPDSLMARFYALEFSAFDAVRMVVGRPPPIDWRRLFRSPEVVPCESIRR